MLVAALGANLFVACSAVACSAQTACSPLAARPIRRRCSISLETSDSRPDPEAWREFRAKLISGGLKVTGDVEGNQVSTQAELRSSVAPANEALLKQQNEALWREYNDGAWAHVAPEAEIGGLLCRMPLPAQLTHLMKNGDGGGWGDRMRERLLADLPGAGAQEEPAEKQRLFEQFSANAVFTYRLAEGMVSDVLQTIAGKAAKDGKISFAEMSAEEQELVSLYSASKDSWQEVALVLDLGSDTADSDKGAQQPLANLARECVVINRPIAKAMNRQLAELVLNGADDARRGLPPLHDAKFVDRFLEAFGDSAAVYVGGPEKQESPGVILHGWDLPGASELAPGTQIYTGGVEAIVDSVLEGTRRPLDFRFFVGRRCEITTTGGAWTPVACSRPVALKQCLGLPKPLWHEVLELCGGSMAELSAIELLKRDDLDAD